jgi:pyruvate dehydrogenase E2 component (dihydrolipoamide acetyltransferase)
MAEIVMPRLSDTMEEGTILSWLIADGEHVRRGQELVEIETDKANMTYESDQEGVLQRIAAEGDTLPVGAVIAHIGSGDDPEISVSTEVPAAEIPTTATPKTEDSPTGARVKASPLARRIASERGVDLHTVTGSGPGGRIIKADLQETPAAPPPPAGPADVTTAKGETTVVELSRTQQTIARRMSESKATIPHFALQADVDMEACVALRSELKKLAPQPHAPAGAESAVRTPSEASEVTPTYNDMVVKASALALREEPRANSSYRDGKLQLHARVNVGVAVAVESDEPTGGALIVPTVFDADQKSLGEIARETRALAAKVREGTITPPELGGGTFTVSNLGMFGVTAFTAIINPPQAAILSVGALAPRAVVRDGDVVARNTMTITLACDHRILYGADAARFLARVRELLEAPAALTL